MEIKIQNKDFWVAYIQNLTVDAKRHLDRGKMQQVCHQQSGPTVVYEDNSWNFWESNTTYVSHSDSSWGSSRSEQRKSSESDEEDDNGAAAVALIIGVIVTVVSVFFVAMLSTRATEEEKALAYTAQISRQLDKVYETEDRPQILGQLKRLVAHRLDIESIDRNRTHHYALVAFGFVVSGAFLFSGGLYVAPLAIKSGYLSLFASTVLGAIMLGSHWNDEGLKAKSYEAIIGKGGASRGLAQQILMNFKDYDANLNLKSHVTEMFTTEVQATLFAKESEK